MRGHISRTAIGLMATAAAVTAATSVAGCRSERLAGRDESGKTETHAAAPTLAVAAHAAGHGREEERVAEGGLAVTQGGFTLWPDAPRVREAGVERRFTFRILGEDGKPVREFTPQHEHPLHLVVVRTDLKHFQHLHPQVDADGVWSVPLRLPEAGTYRLMADFVSRDSARVLGTNLMAGGDFDPETLPESADRAETDGYAIALERPADLRPGQTAPLRFRVTRSGETGESARPVVLTPVMGARGHLVALREGDLAYLHAHPGEAAGPADMRFDLAMPGPGRYRLFLQFGEGGAVHTAAFTLAVEPAGSNAAGDVEDRGHDVGSHAHHHSH